MSQGTLRARLLAATGSAATAVAHAPENAAYGLIAFAPLGPTLGAGAMAATLLGTVGANLLASWTGAGRLVSGPRAALALLTAGLVVGLSEALGHLGVDDPRAVLLWVGLGIAAAGALQVLFGMLRLGALVKYTPHPVRTGVAGGVGLLLIVNALPVAAGHPFGSPFGALMAPPNPVALGLAGIAAAVTAAAARRRFAFQPMLLGLGVAALCHGLASQLVAGIDAGPLLETPALGPWWLDSVDDAAAGAMHWRSRPIVALVGSYALTVAVLCSLDTLLAASIVDGHLRRHRDASRELVAQGLGVLASAGIGGQPVSTSIPRSLALLGSRDGPDAGTVLGYALAMLVVTLALPHVIGLLPASAVAGLLLLQGVQMATPVLWRVPLELWRSRRRAARATGATRRRTLEANWAVELVVAFGAVALGLGPAVLIGAACAILLFVRANLRDVVRRELSGRSRHSLKARPPQAMVSLKREGGAIALLELEGPLFFGTADGLRVRLESLATSVDTVVLDLNQVGEIDVTGARILFETARQWDSEGRRLVFAEWSEDDARRRVIEAVGSGVESHPLHFAATADLALERAEDALLARIEHGRATAPLLTVGETLLGRGLDVDELALLTSKLHTLRLVRGQTLFDRGDSADSLYVSLHGDIGLRVPGGTRRLASFAAGVMVGEMGMLSHGVRSASAVAESDLVAVRLDGADFDALVRDHPPLGAKLLRNMSLQLGDRVRALTADLGLWMSRTAMSGESAVAARDEGETLG